MYLGQAVERNDLESVRQMLTSAGQSIEEAEIYRAFGVAVARGSTDLILLLLSYVDVNASRYSGSRTAIHIAAENQRPEVIKILLQHGANVNARDISGATALHISIDSEIESAISLSDSLGCYIPPIGTTTAFLITNGADVNIRTKNGMTPLKMALDGHILARHLLQQEGATESGTTD